MVFDSDAVLDLSFVGVLARRTALKAGRKEDSVDTKMQFLMCWAA